MLVRFFAYAMLVGAAACGPGDPPENPDWSNVAPILRAECGNCHGSAAAVNGSSYRFDFYDMTADPCGDAAAALDGAVLARGLSNTIAKAITSESSDVRPIMPPLPAPYLTENEWMTILRWTANPIKGNKPANNLPPLIRVDGTSQRADELALNVVVSDPDGDPVVGVVKVGDQVVARMDRSGAFSATYDTSSWPAGDLTISAVLCDGWSRVSANLLQITINH